MKKLAIAVSIILGINICYAQSVWDEPVVTVAGKPMDIEVYRSPTCGCCSKWEAHIKQHGFNVQDNVIEDIQSIKDQYAVNRTLASCHTAVIGDYIIEGHVPANDIKAMLQAKSATRVLAVPGMVVGTPGMEMGEQKMPFKVMALDQEGRLEVYKAYNKY